MAGGVPPGSSARNGAGPGAHGAPGSHSSLQQLSRGIALSAACPAGHGTLEGVKHQVEWGMGGLHSNRRVAPSARCDINSWVPTCTPQPSYCEDLISHRYQIYWVFQEFSSKNIVP